MKILAFDTSNRALSLAVLEDKDLLGQVTLNIKKNHSITLMPAIDFLMKIWIVSRWLRGRVATQA